MSGRVPSAAGASSGRAACLAACLVAFLVVVAAPAMGAERSAPKRILLLHSFGRDFRPWSEYALSIKAVLEQQAQWPLDVQEHTLLTARFNNPGPEEPFVNYLRSSTRAYLQMLLLASGRRLRDLPRNIAISFFPIRRWF